ncbi:MAG: hypothetical protein ACJA01_004284 [Saprospiraceae bacterium]|jgi:hypothetical protein
MNCILSNHSKFNLSAQQNMYYLNTFLLKYLFLSLLIFSLDVSSQNMWIGGSGDWDVSYNRSSGSLPTFTDDGKSNSCLYKVTIPNGYTARAKSLSTESGTLLSIENGGLLNLKDGSGGVNK